MLGFNCAVSSLPPDFNTFTDAQTKAFILSLVKDWDPKVTDIINAIPGDNIYSFHPKTSAKPANNWRAAAAAAAPGDPNPGNPRVWFLGDAIHPMLPSRGMGGNQAMHDSGSACMQLVALAALADEEGVTDEQVEAAVGLYEGEMIPRAFGWVAASGGGLDEDGMPSFNFDGVGGGWVKLMLIKRVLDVAEVFGWARRAVGWVPVDDAPEFR